MFGARCILMLPLERTETRQELCNGPIGAELHIWIVPLGVPDDELPALQSLLSPDEVQTADRIRIPHVRSASIVSRGALRLLLSRYLDRPADDLCFRRGSNGKPMLNPPPAL